MHSVDPLLDLAAAEIERQGGMTVSRGQSDLTAIFETGDPQDQVRQAAQAALAITAAVETVSRAAARVRAAFDTGDVIVRTVHGADGQRPSFNGSPLRVARRLVQALNQGVVAVTSRSREAADGSVRLEPLEPSAYPSFAHEQRVYRLVGTAPVERAAPIGPQREGSRG